MANERAINVSQATQIATSIKGQLTDINGRLVNQENSSNDLYWDSNFGKRTKTFSFVTGAAHSTRADTIDFYIPSGKTFGFAFSAATRYVGIQIHATYADGTTGRIGAFSDTTWAGTFTASKDIAKIGLYITADQPSGEITFSISAESGIVGAVKANAEDIASKMPAINESLNLAKGNLVSGSLQTSTMTVSANAACVSYLSKIPVNPGEKIQIDAPAVSGVSSYRYRFGFYGANGAYKSQISMTTSNELTVGADVYFISFMVIGYDSEEAQVAFNVLSAFSDTDTIDVIFLNRIIPTSDFALKSWAEENFEKAGKSGKVNCFGFSKGVTSELLGSLAYAQAFCVYDGKYYSIDGSNIAEQDANFNILRNVALSTGHGNSLQLGHNGKAYASGWNDGKIYVVDLSTLAVESVITIPITGYFSAVVDDLNNIAYIIHRDSYPDTVATYTFSVFDITQNQIISTKKINAFGGLQSCDFQNGNILVIYGLGTSAVSNGMTIYNSVGDIVATFELDIFDITETEGCAFDRDSNGIFVSLYNNQIYKVS